MDTSESLLKKAILMEPNDRFYLIEGLIRSLDEPNAEIDDLWINEAKKRLKAHREKKNSGVTFKKVFGEEL